MQGWANQGRALHGPADRCLGSVVQWRTLFNVLEREKM